MVIEEVEFLKLDSWKYLSGKFHNNIFKDLPPASKTLFTATGRAALRLILEYYVEKGILADRNTEVLIPQWLCQSVVHTMHRFCHPVLKMSKQVKGVLVYHQYGFPQNMDEIMDFCNSRNLFVIEDCANVYQGQYKGRSLGTFGNASIFSFSKLFPSMLGGALATSDKELLDYAATRAKNSQFSNLAYVSRFWYEVLKDTRFSDSATNFQEMAYGLVDRAFRIKKLSLRVVSEQINEGAIERRINNYKLILDYFSDRPEYFESLERAGVVPYVVPLFAHHNLLHKLETTLKSSNVQTGIYHFDINRNVLDTKFKRCLWLPVHQGLSPKQIAWMCDLIKKAEEI